MRQGRDYSHGAPKPKVWVSLREAKAARAMGEALRKSAEALGKANSCASLPEMVRSLVRAARLNAFAALRAAGL